MSDIYNSSILQGRETDDASLGIVQSENTAETATCQESPIPGEQHRDTSGDEQEASPHGTSDKLQSAVSQSKVPDGDSQQEAEELPECEQKVRDGVRGSLDTVGKYLCAIRDKKLYTHRINPNTGKPYTWEEYCPDVLKISVQYADRKMAAWKTREKVKRHIDEKVFDELPLTTSPWVELSRRDENEQVDVIQGLISKSREENVPLGRLKASDVRDFQINTVVQDEPSDEGNYDDEDDEEGGLDDSDAIPEEPMAIKKIAQDVANGRTIDFTSLSPANCEELRKELENMLEENKKEIEERKKVQSSIESFLKMLDDEADDEATKDGDQLAS